MKVKENGCDIELAKPGQLCNECKRSMKDQPGLIVFRYRGKENACRNLWYHKDCVIKCLNGEGKTASNHPPSNRATCWICEEGKVDFRFRCPGKGNYSYGGYHKSCVEALIANCDDWTMTDRKIWLLKREEEQRITQRSF